MPADTLLIILLAALAGVTIPAVAWFRAKKRIRDLEMTLLSQATDADRYEELRGVMLQVVSNTEQLADTQDRIANRRNDRVESPPLPKPAADRPVTPH